MAPEPEPAMAPEPATVPVLATSVRAPATAPELIGVCRSAPESSLQDVPGARANGELNGAAGRQLRAVQVAIRLERAAPEHRRRGALPMRSRVQGRAPGRGRGAESPSWGAGRRPAGSSTSPTLWEKRRGDGAAAGCTSRRMGWVMGRRARCAGAQTMIESLAGLWPVRRTSLSTPTSLRRDAPGSRRCRGVTKYPRKLAWEELPPDLAARCGAGGPGNGDRG